MSRKHFEFWPKGLPHDLSVAGDQPVLQREGCRDALSRQAVRDFFRGRADVRAVQATEAERLAGYLQQDCGVQQGDRVLLVMQNSPQFIVSYYAILRANAIVVPVNPMSVTAELEHYVQDSGAKVALVAQEVYPQIKPLLGAKRRSRRRRRVQRLHQPVDDSCACRRSSARRARRSPMPGVTLVERCAGARIASRAR